MAGWCLLITAGCTAHDERTAAPRAVATPVRLIPTGDCPTPKLSSTPLTPRHRTSGHILGVRIIFPCGWTPIEPDAVELAHRWQEAGIVSADLRAAALRLARQHDLLVVADQSADTSPTHSLTVYTVDCTDGPHTITGARARLRADLTRRRATGVPITSTTVEGYPALKVGYTTQRTGLYSSGQPIWHMEELVSAGDASCSARMITDQPSRYDQAAFDAVQVKLA
jgi:hypothetical protein